MTRRFRALRLVGAGILAFAGLAGTAVGSSAAATAPAILGITVTPDHGSAALTPQLPNCPSLVIPGAHPSVKGTGFSHASSITLTFDGKKVGTAKTNSKGTFTKTFTVPAAVFGTHNVVAKDSHGASASQLVRVGGFTCFQTSGTSSLTVTWGVGGVDPHTPASIVFNSAIVHQTTTNATGGVNNTFSASCQPGTTSWVVHVVQGGQAATAQGTFTPSC